MSSPPPPPPQRGFAKAFFWSALPVVAGIFFIFALARHRLTTLTEEFSVTVVAPGFSVAAAEQAVTVPLEQALSQVQGLESVRSTTRAGLTVIHLRVATVGTEATPAVMLVRDAVERTRPNLPQAAEFPVVQRLDTDLVTQHFIARSSTLSLVELSHWLDRELRMKLVTQVGVREVKLCGAAWPQVTIDLDLPRLRAVGVRATDVLHALENLDFRAGVLNVPGDTTVVVRPATRGLDALRQLVIKDGDPQMRLSEVALVELGAESGHCQSVEGVLVSIAVTPQTKLKLPVHPAVNLIPFTPVRTATFVRPEGLTVEQTLVAAGGRFRGAAVTVEGDEVKVLFPEEPTGVPEVLGLPLRALDERHAVVQLSGDEFEQLEGFALTLRESLAEERATRWLGTVWPMEGPEEDITAKENVKGVSQAIQLALFGVEVSRLEDGTPIRLRAGRKLEDAFLPDGRAVTEVADVSVTRAPSTVLRIDQFRAIELEVGLDRAQVEKVLSGLALPEGYFVKVVDTNE